MNKSIVYIILLSSISHFVQAKSTFETYGDIGQLAIPLIAAGISLGQEDYDGLKQFGYSALSSEATVQILKYTVDEKGPDGEGKSFPSGHTARAFTGATYLQIRYGWEYGIPAYLAAGAVGWSRVDANQHYWRDVLVGAAIGTGFTYLFTTPQDQQYAFYPMMDSNFYGVGFNYAFK